MADLVGCVILLKNILRLANQKQYDASSNVERNVAPSVLVRAILETFKI